MSYVRMFICFLISFPFLFNLFQKLTCLLVYNRLNVLINKNNIRYLKPD